MTSTSNIHHHCLLFSIFSFLLLALAVSSTTFLPNNIFEPHGSSLGRSLLQAKQNCPVDFENQNYTIITNKCKGPNYPAKACCDALKEFACPFADDLVKNVNCADTMFSYINLYGKYPPSLFASQCREDKIGLQCPDYEEKKKSNRAHIAAPTHSIMLPLTAAFLFFSFFHFF